MTTQDLDILIVDDTDIVCKKLTSVLSQAGYNKVRYAANAQQALELLNRQPADVVLADWIMPGMDGLEMAESIRQLDEAQQRYSAIILFTSKEGIEPLEEALSRGVDDYLRKPINDRELIARIRSAARMGTLHNTALRTANVLRRDNQRLQELATTDPLTGLGNRRFMQAHLESLINETTSRGGVASCAIVDLDKFKLINDRFGHPVGDEVLCGFAQRLRWTVRPTDMVARIGGEEFAILTHHPDQAKFTPLLFERIRRNIAQNPIKTSEGDIPITASIGLASYSNNDDPITPDELIKKADDCLYKAKQQGRNRVVC